MVPYLDRGGSNGCVQSGPKGCGKAKKKDETVGGEGGARGKDRKANSMISKGWRQLRQLQYEWGGGIEARLRGLKY